MSEIKRMKGDLDVFYDGPQVVERGRLHRLELEVYVPHDATPEEIEEYIQYELGYGSITEENPLYDGRLEVSRVTHMKDTGMVGYTLWEAKNERGDGKRYGSNVVVRAGEPVGYDYVKPDKPSET